MGQSEDYNTGCLLHHNLDFIKKELDTNPKAIQQIEPVEQINKK